jgi:hypothetical protein
MSDIKNQDCSQNVVIRPLPVYSPPLVIICNTMLTVRFDQELMHKEPEDVVLQGGDPLSPTAPSVVHLSVPWREDRAPLSPAEMPDVSHAFPSFLIKCDPHDFVRVLKAHTDYWRGIRYDEGNLRRDAGFGGAGSEPLHAIDYLPSPISPPQPQSNGKGKGKGKTKHPKVGSGDEAASPEQPQQQQHAASSRKVLHMRSGDVAVGVESEDLKPGSAWWRLQQEVAACSDKLPDLNSKEELKIWLGAIRTGSMLEAVFATDKYDHLFDEGITNEEREDLIAEWWLEATKEPRDGQT